MILPRFPRHPRQMEARTSTRHTTPLAVDAFERRARHESRVTVARLGVI